jgi:uncharacterized protein (TIGR02246 family)
MVAPLRVAEPSAHLISHEGASRARNSTRGDHALIEAAFNAGDREAFAELHEEDASVVVPPRGERVHGKDAIRTAIEATFALRPHARIEFLDKVESDDMALTHARWNVTGFDGGRPIEMSGRGTIVSRRQADGSWRIVLENSMSPE